MMKTKKKLLIEYVGQEHRLIILNRYCSNNLDNTEGANNKSVGGIE